MSRVRLCFPHMPGLEHQNVVSDECNTFVSTKSTWYICMFQCSSQYRISSAWSLLLAQTAGYPKPNACKCSILGYANGEASTPHARALPLPPAAGVAAVVRLGHRPRRAALRLHLPRLRRGGGGRVRGVQHHPARDRPEPAPAVSVPGRHAHIRRPAAQDPGPPAPARRRRRTQHERPQEATDAYHLMAAAGSPLACPGAAAAPRGEIRWFNGFGSEEREGREEEAAGGDVVAGAQIPLRPASSPLEKAPVFKGLLLSIIFLVGLYDFLFSLLQKPMPRLGNQRKILHRKSFLCISRWSM